MYLLLGMALLAMCFNLMQESVFMKIKRLGRRLGLLRDRSAAAASSWSCCQIQSSSIYCFSSFLVIENVLSHNSFFPHVPPCNIYQNDTVDTHAGAILRLGERKNTEKWIFIQRGGNGQQRNQERKNFKNHFLMQVEFYFVQERKLPDLERRCVLSLSADGSHGLRLADDVHWARSHS